MTAPVLPPIGPDLAQWGRQLSAYLSRQLPRLFTKTASDNPSENGILLWDEADGYPVVSRNNQFVEVVVRVDVPLTDEGSAGDKAGLISWDTNYIYLCNGTYDGVTQIWSRTSHLGGSW